MAETQKRQGGRLHFHSAPFYHQLYVHVLPLEKNMFAVQFLPFIGLHINQIRKLLDFLMVIMPLCLIFYLKAVGWWEGINQGKSIQEKMETYAVTGKNHIYIQQ